MENIRNFVIIAHIDHGKSTLADRLLELTETIEARKMQNQVLDSMELEREKGITIKMQPVRMNYKSKNNKNYILNLIDTPGHIDFGYEVSRSLATVEGAVLLVDATKGIQAQTIANLELAKKQGLTIIPVINKIDLKNIIIEEIEDDLVKLLEIKKEDILHISAKNKLGVQSILERIVEKVPSPKEEENIKKEGTDEKESLKALIFDSFYDKYKGVIAFVRVFNGTIGEGDKVYLMQNNISTEVKEVGYIKPHLVPTKEINNGEIGYVVTNIKNPEQVSVGETIILEKAKDANVTPLKGYKKSNPLIFLSIFPKDSDYKFLLSSLEKLKLNDSALAFKAEFKEGIGRGFQCSFLGLLHAEIIIERLRREFNLDLVLSAPSVTYKSIADDSVLTTSNWPNNQSRIEAKELWIMVDILTYKEHLGTTLKLVNGVESEQLDIQYLGDNKINLVYNIPLREIVIKNFYDKLKSVTQGYASMSYDLENLEWKELALVKLDVLILGKKEEIFSRIIPIQEAESEARLLAKKLKENIPPQQFKVPLQVAIGGRIAARETLSARRKDVTAGLYGGDVTRKRKVLERQKKGKKEMQTSAKIKIPPQIVLNILK